MLQITRHDRSQEDKKYRCAGCGEVFTIPKGTTTKDVENWHTCKDESEKDNNA